VWIAAKARLGFRGRAAIHPRLPSGAFSFAGFDVGEPSGGDCKVRSIRTFSRAAFRCSQAGPALGNRGAAAKAVIEGGTQPFVAAAFAAEGGPLDSVKSRE
jgi:hypothetical protein